MINEYQANSLASTQVILLVGLLWDALTLFLFHMAPMQVTFFSQMNSFHVPPSNLCKVHCNIIILSTRRYYKWLHLFCFSSKTYYAFIFTP